MVALPAEFTDERPDSVVDADDQYRSEERDKSPETSERISKTTEVLGKLVNAAQEYAVPHARSEGKTDLAQIDLRAYTDEATDTAYHLALGFNRTSPDNNLILTLESPRGQTNPWEFFGANAAGVRPKVLKVQDFLYRKDADTVPVRDADFSYVYDYRPYGAQQKYDAPKALVDQILWMVSEAHVVKQGQKGPKVIDLVPEIASLIAPENAQTGPESTDPVQISPVPDAPNQFGEDPNQTTQ